MRHSFSIAVFYSFPPNYLKITPWGKNSAFLSPNPIKKDTVGENLTRNNQGCLTRDSLKISNYILYPLADPSCDQRIVHRVQVDSTDVVYEQVDYLT